MYSGDTDEITYYLRRKCIRNFKLVFFKIFFKLHIFLEITKARLHQHYFDFKYSLKLSLYFSFTLKWDGESP